MESNTSLSKDLLDTLYQGTKIEKNYRVNHAKGILLNGYFMATAQGKRLSKAFYLSGKKIPVIVRFSNSSGIPNINDSDKRASPRGVSIRFISPESDLVWSDIVGHSVNAFPAATPEEFLVFLRIANLVGTQPQEMENYLKNHTAARNFFAQPMPVPKSYARENFYFLHAFDFKNENMIIKTGRYFLSPIEGASYYTDNETTRLDHDFLSAEMLQRINHGGEARFVLSVQLAQREDNIDDISQAWPSEWENCPVGELVLTGLNTQAEDERNIAFNPSHLADGIEKRRDRMLESRNSVYQLSQQKRMR